MDAGTFSTLDYAISKFVNSCTDAKGQQTLSCSAIEATSSAVISAPITAIIVTVVTITITDDEANIEETIEEVKEEISTKMEVITITIITTTMLG